MRKCMQDFAKLLASRDTCIYVRTYEENQFIKDLADILSGNAEYSIYPPKEEESFENKDAPKTEDEEKNLDNISVYVFTRFEGMYKIDLKAPDVFSRRVYNRDIKNINQLFHFIQQNSNNAQIASDNFDFIETLSEATGKESTKQEEKKDRINIFILKDLHLFFDKDTIRTLRDIKEDLNEATYCPIIVTAPVVDIPCELEKLFTLFEYDPMDKQDIYNFLHDAASEVGYSEEAINEICGACIGLTEREIYRAISHSVADVGTVDTKIIHDEKIQIVKKSGALDYLEPQQTLETTGGYDSLKTWIRELKIALTPEAARFGIVQPKGAMLVGLPGNGKTMTADIIENYLKIPLLKLDLARIMGSFVGQSERQIANALRIVKACRPCVLLIDEAEKLFGGYKSSSNTDSGTLSRVLAQLLNFLQEDNTGVITIMTSNDVFELPPELMRSGRLDAQWYFGFPDTDERREILNIYLEKNNLQITENIFNYIIRTTRNYSGAEIKEIVKNLLVKSYFRQLQEGKTPEREVTVDDAKQAIASIVPIYQSSKEKIDVFTEMAKGRYRNASVGKGVA